MKQISFLFFLPVPVSYYQLSQELDMRESKLVLVGWSFPEMLGFFLTVIQDFIIISQFGSIATKCNMQKCSKNVSKQFPKTHAKSV